MNKKCEHEWIFISWTFDTISFRCVKCTEKRVDRHPIFAIETYGKEHIKTVTNIVCNE